MGLRKGKKNFVYKVSLFVSGFAIICVFAEAVFYENVVGVNSLDLPHYCYIYETTP